MSQQFFGGSAGGGGGGLADPGANGIVVRTALNVTIARTIVAGTGISVANGDGVSGNPQISVTGGGSPNFADNETPSGTINGSNTAFTLANSPSPALSLELFLNGILQRPGGVDYTLSGNTITYAVAPQTGDNHVAYYRY